MKNDGSKPKMMLKRLDEKSNPHQASRMAKSMALRFELIDGCHEVARPRLEFTTDLPIYGAPILEHYMRIRACRKGCHVPSGRHGLLRGNVR